MEALTKAVETTIGEEMPDDFGLIIDGWTHGTEHYLAAYGCYETTGGRPKHPLLSLAPVMDEPDDHLNADGHIMAISRFLPFSVKSLDGCRFLVGDNCAETSGLQTCFAFRSLAVQVTALTFPYANIWSLTTAASRKCSG
ncbi:hypothetical protein PI124_g15706 [Phytophthora idaei]|nr:hypothetical protein PI125_g15813 [Phytophthora idaei]KAG3142943.1 hypothetical protein PI126_g14830 [Phytophthora idaei]KAG3239350.1 hypothetical protein PI124_g15706 [Phytophthora idaei]